MPVQIAKWDSARDAWTDENRIDLFSGLSDVFLGTFPNSGMTLNGVAFELPTWGHHMDDSGSSYLPSAAPETEADQLTLLRTPMAEEGRKASTRQGAEDRVGHHLWLTNQVVDLLPTVTVQDGNNNGGPAQHRRKSPPLNAKVQLLKTPTSQLAVNGGSQHPDKRRTGGHGPTLADEVEHLLPTPKASDGEKGGPNQRGSSGDRTLPSIGHLLPTPLATMGNGVQDLERRVGGRGSTPLLMPTPQAHDAQKGKTAEQVAAMRAKGHGVANLNELAENELTLLPTPVAQPSGNTPEDHLRKKPGREVVTDLAIITENGLLLTGGRMNQPFDDGSRSWDGELPGQLSLLDVLEGNA